MIRRLEQVREYFEKEAAVFDQLFFRVMPRYEEMMGALAEALPFKSSRRLDIVDLGCGTGNLSLKILNSFPKAHLTCLDLAENMLIMAKAKLSHRQASFWKGDIRDFPYRSHDAIVSSMVLHHIEKKDKPGFYRRLRAGLKPKGAFYNIDIFTACDQRLQALFTDRWKAQMRSNGLPARKVNEMLRRHQREDCPLSLSEECQILREAGFACVEVIKKEYNFCVYGGIKRR